MTPGEIMSTGAGAMFIMCIIARYCPLMVALLWNFGIWYVAGRLCGVWS